MTEQSAPIVCALLLVQSLPSKTARNPLFHATGAWPPASKEETDFIQRAHRALERMLHMARQEACLPAMERADLARGRDAGFLPRISPHPP
jgi:hypothetical protein